MDTLADFGVACVCTLVAAIALAEWLYRRRWEEEMARVHRPDFAAEDEPVDGRRVFHHSCGCGRYYTWEGVWLDAPPCPKCGYRAPWQVLAALDRAGAERKT